MILEDKHADVKARRNEDDFSYLWTDDNLIENSNIKTLIVEFVPSNWPALTVVLSEKKESIKDRIKILEEIGFKIEE